MRFLVVTRPSHPLPPEPGMVDAMQQWVDTHREAGRMEQVWTFAGAGGGGGILDVDSLEELEEVMSGFPFRPFSEVDVLPLTDLDASLERLRGTLARMA